MAHNRKIKFYNADPKWLEYKEFNCRLENCVGPLNVLVRDLDGTFMGQNI